MAEQFVNPKTDKLLCPLNDFRDCVQEMCFFWTESDAANDMYDSAFRHLPEAERPKVRDTCFLLIARQISRSAFEDVQQARDVVLDLFSALVEGQLPRPQKQPSDLAIYRRLNELSEKLDQLLQRASKP